MMIKNLPILRCNECTERHDYTYMWVCNHPKMEHVAVYNKRIDMYFGVIPWWCPLEDAKEE